MTGRLFAVAVALLLVATVVLVLAVESARGGYAIHVQANERKPQVEQAIRYVFGPYAPAALRVAWCESRYDIWARNGTYLGLFQLGGPARARYGHAWNAWAQAISAYRYFADSGYSWQPWTCRPG